MRIGLVLGAGGLSGGSWLSGALEGLEAELGWSPTGAERIVGTSAGALVGAMVASGVSPSYLAAHCTGHRPDALSHALARAETSRLDGSQRALAERGPGSWRLALTTLSRPHRHTHAAVLAGWLPRGLTPTDAIRDAARAAAHRGPRPHPGFHAVACDYRTGRREPLAGAPDAVAASCAIPGFYRPVEIAGRHFVDGAVHSPSNLDLLAGAGLDLVICLNPLSSHDEVPARTLGERAAAAVRRHAGRLLGREAQAVRAAGTPTILLQPTAADLAAMAAYAATRHGRGRVVASAASGVREQLRGLTLPAPGQPRLRAA